MQFMNVSRASLALCLLGSLLSAQDPKKTPEPQGQPKEAALRPDAPVLLKFTVTGLTQDNLGKIKEGLTALTTQIYVCSACQVDQITAGKCPKCSGELKAEKRPVIQSAQPMAEDSSISVTIAQGRELRYSELDGALSKNSVHIDLAKFPIAGKAHLILRGATADSLAAIEKALKDPKLFETAKASYDAAKGEIMVKVHAGAIPPTRASVTTALEATGTKASLMDIVWGPVPPKA
jgi:hypothetical protein